MADTAVIEAPVTAEAPEAPPQEAAPETDLEPSPETESSPETPDSEPDPYDGLTPKEIADKVRTETDAVVRKDERAKAEESFRRQLENQAQQAAQKAQFEANQANAQRAANMRQGWAQDALGQITKAAFEQGKDAPDPRAVAQVAAELNAAQFHEAHTQLADALWTSLQAEFPGYRPSQELSSYAQAASTAYDRAAMVAAQTHMIREAVEQSTVAQTQARTEAEAAAQATQRPIAPKPKPGGPTSIAGGTGRGGRPTTLREADVLVAAATTAEGRRSALEVAKALRRAGAAW